MRTHRRAAGVALALVSTFLSIPSLADSFQGTRFELHEKAHTVEARLEHGHATLVVTRTVQNDGPKSDQALFHIDLPTGAVATRLRTSGTGPNGETVWFEGELMEAEAAAKKYQELTGIGGYYPKDPALLSWRSQTHLALQVFPVPGRGTKTVEYTLRIPLQYEAGVYKMTLPNLGTQEQPAKVRLTSAIASDTIEVNGVAVTPATAVTASRELEVTLVPRSASPIEGALASLGFADKRALVHGRVSAAPRLSQVPANAAIVVLIDASRSVENDITAQIASARAYLSSFASADVEVLTFDRAVHSPFGGPLPVREALAKLHGFAPTLENGSRLDDALARADEHLARSSAPAKRIVLLTDLRSRDALTPEKFAARALTSGAIVHVATVKSGGTSLVRDDESAWAKLPRASGGLYWKASCDLVDPLARSVFEEWARPKRISKLVVKGLPEDFSAPDELLEGQGIEHLGIDTKPAAQLAIEGELWSRSFRWSTSPSADETRRWAGLVFGSNLLSQLSEKEQMTLALHGRAVSPVTSYLAIEPGVRPSTEGLTGEEIGFGSIGTMGHGFGSGSGRLFGAGRVTIDRQSFLDKALGAALDTCGAKDEHAKATIESTILEIVDVREVALTQRSAKVESCVTEELWKVSLPRQFDDEHMTWTASR